MELARGRLGCRGLPYLLVELRDLVLGAVLERHLGQRCIKGQTAVREELQKFEGANKKVGFE